MKDDLAPVRGRGHHPQQEIGAPEVSINESSAERWLPVIGFEGYYEVSDRGRVRGVDRLISHWRGGPKSRLRRGQILKGGANPRTGHIHVNLGKDGPRRNMLVHRMVLEAFVGPCPDGMEGCHNNGNSIDNQLSNLRWDTKRGNSLDAVRHGVHPHARKTECVNKHPFTPENTLVLKGGRRKCRECGRISVRAHYARKRAAAADPATGQAIFSPAVFAQTAAAAFQHFGLVGEVI